MTFEGIKMTITKKTQKTNTLLIDSDEDVVNTHEISDSFKKSESSIKSTNKEVSHEHEVTDDTSQVLTEKELIEKGIKIIYFPYTKGISSTKISQALVALR